MSNTVHTTGVAAFAIAVGLAGAAAGQFASLPDHVGRVAQYNLAPDGAVDGVILTDGTEVLLPPDAAGELVAAVRPGDAVTVRGRPAGETAAVIDAVVVVNNATGAMAGTGPFGGARPYEGRGKILRPLHDTEGEVNGALLEDGTIIRLPPAVAAANAANLAAGKPLYVKGFTEEGPLGRLVLAEDIGANANTASQIAAPSPGR